MTDISFTSKAQSHYKKHQSKAKTLYLSQWLMRIFFGVNLGLGLSNFSLGNHIPNCKGILRGVGISFILCLLLPLPLPLLLLLCFLFCPRRHHCPILLFFNPCWYFNILRRFLGWERLFRRRRKGRGRRRSSWILWGPLDSTLGPLSSDRSLQGFPPDQGLDCMFQHSTPCRPRSLQQLTLPSSPAPHVRKLSSRRPWQLPGLPLIPPQLSAV